MTIEADERGAVAYVAAHWDDPRGDEWLWHNDPLYREGADMICESNYHMARCIVELLKLRGDESADKENN